MRFIYSDGKPYCPQHGWGMWNCTEDCEPTEEAAPDDTVQDRPQD